jgi:hypothetical protein
MCQQSDDLLQGHQHNQLSDSEFGSIAATNPNYFDIFHHFKFVLNTGADPGMRFPAF